MIAAIVGAIIFIVGLLVIVWFVSPAFRAWTEKPKYILLERNELFERAHDEFNNPTPAETTTATRRRFGRPDKGNSN